MSVPTKIFLSNHQFAKSSDAIWLNYSEQVGGGGGGKFLSWYILFIGIFLNSKYNLTDENMEEVEPKMYWRFTIPKSKKCLLCFLTTTIKHMITYDL